MTNASMMQQLAGIEDELNAGLRDLDDGTGVAKETIAIDFDGVIHDQPPKFTGSEFCIGLPVPGAAAGVAKLRKQYRVVVFSCRATTGPGRKAIRDWLEKYGIEVDAITAMKPWAVAYIDDRGYRFSSWPETLRDMNY